MPEKKEFLVRLHGHEDDSYNELWKVQNKNLYFARNTYSGEWFFVCDPLGYRELDSVCPDNYSFIVCDQHYNELFRSSNGDGTSNFPSYQQACKNEWASISSNFQLAKRDGHRAWLREFLTEDVKATLKGNPCIEDNFVTFWQTEIEDVIVRKFRYLGEPKAIHRLKYKSDYSAATWYEYVAGDVSTNEYESFCAWLGWEPANA